MKKAFIILLVLVTGLSGGIQAQNQTAKEKIQAAKIALITERLGLTPEQAEKFWPLYNEFDQRRRELRQEYTREKAKLDMATATEEQKKALLDFGLKLKERNLNLERNYSDRMLSIITTDQIIFLRKAEEDFRKMILEQIRQRRMDRQDRKEQFRERANDRQQKRRNN